MLDFTKDDFAFTFGISSKELSQSCVSLINQYDFRFDFIPETLHDELILKSLKKLESGNLMKVGSERREIWENGWEENYQAFISSNYSLEALVPKYYAANKFLRYKQKFINPVSHDFEINFYSILRTWLFEKYLSDTSIVYELGCGTGLNLVLLSQMYSDKKLIGLDWAISSQKILTALAQHYGWNIKGFQFDLFQPSEDFHLEKNSVILTMTSFEQLGGNHGPVVEYILKEKPKMCISVEPILELYDDSKLLDYLAIQYHKSKGYLNNYLTTLQNLEKKGKVEILKIQRLNFGGFFNESYSVVVWIPKEKQ